MYVYDMSNQKKTLQTEFPEWGQKVDQLRQTEMKTVVVEAQ